MADRRQRTNVPKGAKPEGVKKQRKGISVGRALPDGPQRRKGISYYYSNTLTRKLTILVVQQVKREMIEKAKLKKQYAKLRGSNNGNTYGHESSDIPHLGDSRVSPDPMGDDPPPQEKLEDVSEVEWSDEDEEEKNVTKQTPAQRPNRSSQQELEKLEKNNQTPPDRHRKPKPHPFQKEENEATRRKRETEERREARERANRERIQKLDERDRFRKAMAKARTGGKNGQRKLGRESQVLLERVQRMVGQ